MATISSSLKLLKRLINIGLQHLATTILYTITTATAAPLDASGTPLPEDNSGNGHMTGRTITGMFVGMAALVILVIACNKIWTSFKTHQQSLPRHATNEIFTPSYRASRRGQVRLFFRKLREFLKFIWSSLTSPRRTVIDDSIAYSSRGSVPVKSQTSIHTIEATLPTLAHDPSPASSSVITEAHGADEGGTSLVVAEPSQPSPAHLAPSTPQRR